MQLRLGLDRPLDMLNGHRDQLGSPQAGVIGGRQQRPIAQARQIVASALEQGADVEPARLVALDVAHRSLGP